MNPFCGGFVPHKNLFATEDSTVATLDRLRTILEGGRATSTDLRLLVG